VEAGVVPRSEQVRAAEVGQIVGERPGRRDEVLVVAGAGGVMGVVVVVVNSVIATPVNSPIARPSSWRFPEPSPSEDSFPPQASNEEPTDHAAGEQTEEGHR